MRKEIVVYEGKVERDIGFGSRKDGLYIDGDRIETLFHQYEDTKIRVTIERIEEDLEE